MMKWVHQQASIPFELENLPHLNEVDKGRYKEQVREREEALAKKRDEEERAMREEERAQAELKRKKRKLQKQPQKDAGSAVGTAAESTVGAGSAGAGNAAGDSGGSKPVLSFKSGRMSALLDDNDEF